MMERDELMDAPPLELRLALLQLCLLGCVLFLGTAAVRNGTDMLHGLAYSTPVAALAQPSR